MFTDLRRLYGGAPVQNPQGSRAPTKIFSITVSALSVESSYGEASGLTLLRRPYGCSVAGMSEVERKHDLLVLDFGGVCTPSHHETIGPAASSEGGGGGTKPAEALATIRPGCEAVVAAAQNHGIQVVILSNEIDQAWAEAIPLLSQVDRVLACSDNRIFKPDRRAFQRPLLLTGCEADRTLVVDDEIDNIRSAHAIGLNTIHFDITNPEQSWAEITQTLGLS